MTTKISAWRKPVIITAFSAAALLAAPLAMDALAGHGMGISAAQAAESGQGGKGYMGGGAGTGQGQGGPAAGHGGSSMDKVLQGEEEEGEGGQGSMQQGGGVHGQGNYGENKQQGGGQGAPDEDSDAKGPRYSGGRGDEAHGGKPAWAQEGIPEVELGRLSVVRSPEHVLQRALEEGLASITEGMVDFYNQPLSTIIDQLTNNYDSVVRLDSPLQNLALYQDLLSHTTSLNESGLASVGVNVTPANRNDLAALLLGTASDKTMEVSEDTVKAVSIILGVQDQLTASDITDIAAKAEDVREAIATGHGD